MDRPNVALSFSMANVLVVPISYRIEPLKKQVHLENQEFGTMTSPAFDKCYGSKSLEVKALIKEVTIFDLGTRLSKRTYRNLLKFLRTSIFFFFLGGGGGGVEHLSMGITNC